MPKHRYGHVPHKLYEGKDAFAIKGRIDDDTFEDELKMTDISFCGTDPRFFPRLSNFGQLPPKLVSNIYNLMIEKPTAIQSSILPYFLETTFDLAFSGRTGTGKTVAYLIAILDFVGRYRKEHDYVPFIVQDEPFAVIILPTIFAVKEIASIADRIADRTRIRIAIGLKRANQAVEFKDLRSSGCDIYISTIGKVNTVFRPEDEYSAPILKSRRLKFVVLDNLPNSQFRDANEFLKEVVRPFSPECRTVVVSSDWLSEENLFQVIGPTCVKVDINNHYYFCDIKQEIIIVDSNKKLENLLAIFKTQISTKDKALIFVNDSDVGAQMKSNLIGWSLTNEHDYTFKLLHDNTLDYKGQFQELDRFRAGAISFLIVAGSEKLKSLNIPDVNLIINYDFPQTAEAYAIQIGCCGRIYNKGRAISFFDPDFDRNTQTTHIMEICADSGMADAVKALEPYV